MQALTVILSKSDNAVVIVGANGNSITRRADSTLSVAFRRDGGVTVWADGEHRDQTTRVDSYGRLMNSTRAPRY